MTYTMTDIAEECKRAKRTIARWRKEAEKVAGRTFGTVGEDGRVRHFNEQEKALILAQMPDTNTGHSGHDVQDTDAEIVDIVDTPDTYRSVSGGSHLSLRTPVLSNAQIDVFNQAEAQADLADLTDYTAKVAGRLDSLFGQYAQALVLQSASRIQATVMTAEANAMSGGASLMGKQPQQPQGGA